VAYLILCVLSGLAGGFVGRVKGSSFWLWFAVSAVFPVLGIIAALLYRVDRDELRRQCPNCGRLVKLHDALCTRCGAELEFPEQAVVPESAARAPGR
jgi:ribosomal protein S27AE